MLKSSEVTLASCVQCPNPEYVITGLKFCCDWTIEFESETCADNDIVYYQLYDLDPNEIIAYSSEDVGYENGCVGQPLIADGYIEAGGGAASFEHIYDGDYELILYYDVILYLQNQEFIS